MKSLSLDVISMEIRRAFSYRSDFWINFCISAVARVGMAYFLWTAIFGASQAQIIAGLTFSQMILYSVLAYLVDQIVRSSTLKTGIVSREIYDGTLSRYLLYPMSVFKYKFSIALSQGLIGLVQLIIGLSFYSLIFGWPAEPAFSVSSVALGLVCLLPALLSFFLICFVIELTAFWAENVWSLLVMLRFISGFLGGAFLPLDLFPSSVQPILHWLPFYHIIGFPVGVFMGRHNATDVLYSCLIDVFWIVLFSGFLKFFWWRGIRKFAGVGI